MSKIPSHATRVYSGILHDVYHWEQAMFDGTVQTFEALKRRPSVTVFAVTDDGKIVVNDEQQPHNGRCLCIPSGVSESDDLLSDAKRELEEETGYLSDHWMFYAKTDVLHYSKMEWESHFYVARNCKPLGTIHQDSGEKITPRLYDFDEFLAVTQVPEFSNSFVTELVKTLQADPQKLLVFKHETLGIAKA